MGHWDMCPLDFQQFAFFRSSCSLELQRCLSRYKLICVVTAAAVTQLRLCEPCSLCYFVSFCTNYINVILCSTLLQILVTLLIKTTKYTLWVIPNAPNKSKMAAEKRKHCHIWAIIWPIPMKFGSVMHISPPNDTGYQKCEILQIQDRERLPSWK